MLSQQRLGWGRAVMEWAGQRARAGFGVGGGKGGPHACGAHGPCSGPRRERIANGNVCTIRWRIVCDQLHDFPPSGHTFCDACKQAKEHAVAGNWLYFEVYYNDL